MDKRRTFNKPTIIILICTIVLVIILNGHYFTNYRYAYELNKAIENNDVEEFKKILNCPIGNVNSLPHLTRLNESVTEKFDIYPIQTACVEGNYEMVSLLLEHNADVNVNASASRPPYGFTESPLLCALKYLSEDRFKIAQALIEHGANVDFYDISDESFALTECIDSGLYQNGERIGNLQEESNQTIKMILNHSSYGIDQKYWDGKTILILAAERNYSGSCEYLISLGADKTITDKYGNTAYDYAVRSNYTELAEILKPY